MTAKVLVTDGDQRAALAIVRSLGRAGYLAFVCSTDGRSLAGASRYARADLALPSPLREPDRYAEAIGASVKDLGVDVVLPVTEAALLAVLPARGRLAARVPFVDLERFEAVSDKRRLLGIASELGIAIPRQRVLSSRAAGHELVGDELRFPLVLKPSRSVVNSGPGRAQLGVDHVADKAQLRECLGRLPEGSFPLLAQERVVGPGVGIFLLIWDGQLFGAFAHRRIREKPPSGGVSVYRESIAADPELIARSRRLLAHFGWTGLAMIEYKVAAATGTPYLMEINGRFWGSLQLAIDAGVDFPVLLTALALGQRPAPVTTYRVGVRSRWLWGDVDHLLARLRRSPTALALPPGSPGRWRAVWDFLTSWGPADREEILRLDDPRPFVRESRTWFKEL